SRGTQVILLRSLFCLLTSFIACGSLTANKISLKPQVSISRLPSAIISLFAKQKNITTKSRPLRSGL
ncbi:MAG: hypothetical protein ACI4RB_00680, partial [Acutalibacteraceae bacterium]